MANLPENTQYGSSGNIPTGANFSNLLKNFQQKTQAASSDVVKSATPTISPTPIAPAPVNSAWSNIFGKTTPLDSLPKVGGAPIGTPIGTQTPGATKTEPLPSGYSQFTPVEAGKPWVAPTDKTVLRDWPTALGGGQYIVDPSQPGKMIKSTRAIMDYKINPGAKQKVLGNLSPSLYQVDHIVPLWVGGADTLGNLQVYDNVSHKTKTAVQAVPLTLLSSGKINLDEARLMALTWKDKDASGLPSSDEIDKNGGFVPLATAEKIAKKWKEDVGKVNVFKYFGDAFKENMANFGKGIPIFGEFAKGLVGGGTAGIVPGTAPSKESGAVGAVSNIAGNVLGTITGLGLLTKGVAGTIGAAKTAMGIKNAVAVADDTMKAANLITDIGNLAPTALVASKRADTLKKMASSAGLLSLWGQIGITGKEVTGQEDPEFKNHVTQFLTDVAFGGLLGSAGQTVRGYATVGAGSTAFSLMSGEEIVPALQNGALMTALHGMGYKKGLIDPKITTGNEEAYKMAATTLNQYVGEAIPTVKMGQKVPTILKLDIPKIDDMRLEYQSKYPYDQRFLNTTPITNEAEAIDFMGKAAKRNFGNLVAKSDGTIPQEDLKKEMTRITVAQNQLYNHTLPPEARVQKEMKDLISLGEKLRPQVKSSQLRSATNTTKLLNEAPTRTSDEIIPNPEGKKFLEGNVPTTGYGDNIDVASKKTINDFYENPGAFSDKLYIVKDPETASIMRMVQNEQIAAGLKPTTGNPDHALRVFVKTLDGEVRPAGYIPREESFSKKNGLNKTYHEITNRLRGLIERSPSAEELQRVLAKDQARLTLTPEEVTQLFNNKLSVKEMADEDLYAILKPTNAFEKYNSALNNSTLSQAMDQNGVSVLVVDKSKLMPTGGAYPRANPENPYLALNVNEQDWLRSIELRRGTPTPGASVEEGVSNIVSKTKANNMAKTAGNISKLTKGTLAEQLPLPLAEQTGKSPYLESKMPPHVSEPVKTPEVGAKVETPSLEEKMSKIERPEPRKFIKPLGSETDIDGGMLFYTKDPEILKNYSKKELTKLAKEVSNGGENTAEGWDKYLAQRENDIQKATGNPDFHITNPSELRDTRWRYQRMVDSGTRKELYQETKNGKLSLIEGESGNVGGADKTIKDYNKKNGLPEDAMSIISVNKNRQYNQDFISLSTDKITENNRALRNINGDKYIPIGVISKGPDKVNYVKFEPKMVENFNANPEKYLRKDDTNMSDENKFVRAFTVDVLNIPKETSFDDFVKRANLIYNRGDKYVEYEKNAPKDFPLDILESPSVKDFPELDLRKEQFELPDSIETAKTIERYGDGKWIDGQIFIGENLAKRIPPGMGWNEKDFQTGLKLIIDADAIIPGVERGPRITHKGHFAVVDPATREMLKTRFNYDLSPDGMVSFDTNAKIGPKEGSFRIPMSGIFGKNLTAGKEVTMKASREKQFLPSDENVTKDMLKELEKRIPEFEEFNKEISKSNTNEELKDALDKYSEKYNINKDDLFFGTRGETLVLGGGKINLAHNIESVLKNLYLNNIVYEKAKYSTNAFVSAPLPLPLDGANKPLRFVNNDEIILGEESIKKLNANEGDYVLVSRDPVYDINNSVVLKAINGTKYGQTSLGGDRASVSKFNEAMKLGGDQDGDKMLITKIGEGGVPESYANAIMSRGSKAIPFTEVKTREKGPITVENIEKTIWSQAVGDDQTVQIPMINRIGDTMKTNKLTVKIYPAEKNAQNKTASKYELLSNGKVVETGVTTASKKSFEGIPRWGLKEKLLRTQALQEAVDSKKSDDIVKRTGNDPLWMLKQVFSDEKGIQLDNYQARAVKGALKNFQKGFEPDNVADRNKSIKGMHKELKPFNDMTAKIKENGGEVTPWQEKNLRLSQIETFSIPDEVKVVADQLGVKAVKDTIKNIDVNRPALDKIREYAVLAKKVDKESKLLSEKKSAIKRLNDFYSKNVESGEYSKEDIDSIAYWAATSPEANIKHGFMDSGQLFAKPKYIRRYNFMINKSPEVAKVYLEGSEKAPIESTPDGQGGPTPQGEITIIARHGSTGRNGEKVFRGWEESKKNQLTDQGKLEAAQLGEKLKNEIKDPENYIIVSSDLQRAVETARIVSKITGIKTGDAYPQLRSQDTGDYTGRKESEVKGNIEKMISKTPDKPLPGASESYNDFMTRLKKTLGQGGLIELHNPGKKIIVIAHHQVEVVQKNNFRNATDAMFSQGIPPGGHRYIDKKNEDIKPDGKGGLFGDAWGALKDNVIKPVTENASDMGRYALNKLTPSFLKPLADPVRLVKTPTYKVRGVNITDSDLSEARDILLGEVSNRPGKQGFETQIAINTAINRLAANPTKYGGSLTKVLQEPAQYQAYAPNGMNVKGGKVIESQYQKIKKGIIDEPTRIKLKAIEEALAAIKTGALPDITEGKKFYTHAQDGTMWMGNTIEEAKKLANDHERRLKKPQTRWGTLAGLPVKAK